MQRNRCRHLFCICMAVLFAIGILGCSVYVKNVPKNDTNAAEESIAIKSLSSDFFHAAAVVSVRTLQKIDDFQVAAGADGTSANIQSGIRRMPLVLFAAIVLLFFSGISPKQTLYFGEKWIRVFLVITFIHRIDGKKKSCFEVRRKIITGGY